MLSYQTKTVKNTIYLKYLFIDGLLTYIFPANGNICIASYAKLNEVQL